MAYMVTGRCHRPRPPAWRRSVCPVVVRESFRAVGTTPPADCRFNPKVTVYAGCSFGNRVIVHSGAVIGADGFGIAPDEERWVKVPQIGGVVPAPAACTGAPARARRSTPATAIVRPNRRVRPVISTFMAASRDGAGHRAAR